MPFLAELYLAASASLPRLEISGLRSVIRVPADEMCLLVLDAADEAAARAALQTAAVDVERVQWVTTRDVEELGGRR
jgi:hypothetical protein